MTVTIANTHQTVFKLFQYYSERVSLVSVECMTACSGLRGLHDGGSTIKIVVDGFMLTDGDTSSIVTQWHSASNLGTDTTLNPTLEPSSNCN